MRIETHKSWLKDGLQKSIMVGATDAPSEMDKGALAWTLTVLDDDREFEDFVARVPGYLDSDSMSHAPSVILPLMDDQSDPFDAILGSRINDLLKTCVPGTSPLTEQLRRNRLCVCLRTLWYCAREYNISFNTDPLPTYVLTTFVSPEMAHHIQSEEDIASCLMGRSFCSLIIKKLTQDINSRTVQYPRVNELELPCLAAILGKPSVEVAALLSQPGAISLANTVSLMSSEMDILVDEGIPSEVQDIILKTLNILFMDSLWALLNAELPPDLLAIFHKASPLGQRLRTQDLQVDRLRQILEGLSVVRDEPEVTRLAMPEPDLGLGPSTNTYF